MSDHVWLLTENHAAFGMTTAAFRGLVDLSPWLIIAYGLVLVGALVWASVTRLRERRRRAT